MRDNRNPEKRRRSEGLFSCQGIRESFFAIRGIIKCRKSLRNAAKIKWKILKWRQEAVYHGRHFSDSDVRFSRDISL